MRNTCPRMTGSRPFTLLLIALTMAASAAEGNRLNPGESADEDTRRKVFASVLPEDEKGFTRKQSAREGEWLATHPEPAESLNRYIFRPHVRPTTERRTVVLQPLGPINDEQRRMLEAMREYAEIFFQLPARIEKDMPLDKETPVKDLTRLVPLGLRGKGWETQYNADVILNDILKKKLPDDAVACLGITMQDLYSGDLHYVFGLGSMKERVGVYSLARYFPEFWNQKRFPNSEQLALLRACKVLNHEVGHVFGLPHCVFYNCSMNGSNSLPEMDAAPVHFCPICHRKLMWNIGFDAQKQFKELEAFYKKHGLDDEAKFMHERIENWAKVLEAEKVRAQKEE